MSSAMIVSPYTYNDMIDDGLIEGEKVPTPFPRPGDPNFGQPPRETTAAEAAEADALFAAAESMYSWRP